MRTFATLLCLACFVAAGSPSTLAGDAAKNDAAKADTSKQIAKQLSDKNDQQVLGALLEASGNQSKTLTSPLIKLLKNKNAAIRESAIACLGGRTEASSKKRAAISLASRLKPLGDKSTTKPEMLLVVQALHDLAQPTTIKALLDSPNSEERDVRQARAMAVANVPSKEAIERLIQYGYKDRRGEARTRDIATKALKYATQDTGKRGIEGWRKWWKENEREFDVVGAAEKRTEAREKKAAQAKRKEERK
jgi:HEAT repeat protein